MIAHTMTHGRGSRPEGELVARVDGAQRWRLTLGLTLAPKSGLGFNGSSLEASDDLEEANLKWFVMFIRATPQAYLEEVVNSKHI